MEIVKLLLKKLLNILELNPILYLNSSVDTNSMLRAFLIVGSDCGLSILRKKLLFFQFLE